MALKRFDMDKTGQAGGTLLVYSEAANGKTHLIGDMLADEQANGKVLYINVAGEDGMLTISGLKLGNIGVTIETFEDFEDLVKEATEGKRYQAIGLDSLQMLAKLAIKKVVKEDRMPRVVKGSPINEWQETHLLMEKTCRVYFKRLAKFAMVACSIDKLSDQLDLDDKPKPKFIGPNLPGKEAQEVAYWFDFVGELRCRPGGKPGEYVRKLDMVKDNIHIVRQRLPKMITEPITIPMGRGGWKAIKTLIEQHGGFNG